MFRDDVIAPLIESAEKGLIELFFMDAAHFVWGAFPARVWSTVRRWVKTPSGRKRFNVLGALNYVTKKIETVTNTTYITSAQVVEMLEMLAEKYQKPIAVILDNASYQVCKLVRENAERLNINLIFLPTYSPNLNLIERVWKLVKSICLNGEYYEKFSEFTKVIDTCVSEIYVDHKSEMDTLITPDFQIIGEKKKKEKKKSKSYGLVKNLLQK